MDAAVDMALASLQYPVRRALLRAVAIDVLPLWRAPAEVSSYLWTGVGALAPIDTDIHHTDLEQAAARAALSTSNAWHHAARARRLAGGKEIDVQRDTIVCASYLDGFTDLDLFAYRSIWEALEGTVPLTRLLTWGDVEDAWVMADQSMQPLAASESLHDAAFAGDLGTVLALLAKRSDPNAIARSPMASSSSPAPTPLNFAVLGPAFNEQHLEVMRALIRAGAKVDRSHLADLAQEACGTPAEVAAAKLLELYQPEVENWR